MHVLERIRTGPERRASELAARMVLQEICLKALPEQEQKHRIESEESEENDESDESGGDPLDKNYDAEDLAPEARTLIDEDCKAFYEAHSHL
jgi:hypothetical protein